MAHKVGWRSRSIGIRIVQILAVTTCCIAWAAAAFAQVSAGGIRGFVRDESRAIVPGVTVEAQSPSRIGGAATTVTDSQGLYRFEGLPVGIYTVTFSLTGFATVKREGIRVEAGRTIEMEQQLSVSTLQETVTVSGQAPVVDATHAGTSTNLNQETLANIPTSRSQFFDVVPMAPGTSVASGNIGGSSFNVFGSDTNQNAYQYDGLDISSPNFGGSYDWPNYDMMAELQVKSVGASAAQTGFQGGVINLVLKSGSNQLRGSGSFYGMWNSMLGNNTPDEPFPRFVDHRLDYNYTLGGPIKKDRIWALTIGQHIRWNRGESLGVPPDRPDKTRIWRPFVKVDAKLSNADNVSVHYNDCRDVWGYGANKTTPPIAASVEIGKDPVITAGWTRVINSRTLFELRAGGIFVRKDYVPNSGDYVTPGHIDIETGISSVNRTSAAARDNQNKMNINVTLSHAASDFIRGSHDFKFGVQTTPWNSSTYRGAFASDLLLYDFGSAPYYALNQEPYALGGSMPTYGGFVQDDWTVNSRLSLNLGLRYEHINASVPEVEQLNGLLEPTGKVFPGIDDLITFSQWSPRLGATVKLDTEGETVLKSHWGRYYGKLISDQFQSISPGNTNLTAFEYNPVTRRYDLPFYNINPKANFGIDPDLTQQYTDQFFIGLERQLQPSFGVTASFVMKNEHDFIRLKDVGGTYAATQLVDTFQGTSQNLTIYNLTSPSLQSVFQVTNRDDLDQDYKAVVLEANKRFSQAWQMMTSYTWQRNLIYNRGNMATQGFGALSRNGFGRDPNDLTNAYGPSATNNTHAIRFAGTWAAPYGVNLGFRYQFESGRPYARVINVRTTQGVRAVIAEGRGNFESLPSLNDIRLRLDKDIGFGGARRLRLSLDLINLLNGDTTTTLVNNSSQSNFGTVLNVVEPRRAQLGIRFEF
jgi:carboxypeptidase family protein/TonB-dependent receptor-like protein